MRQYFSPALVAVLACALAAGCGGPGVSPSGPAAPGFAAAAAAARLDVPAVRDGLRLIVMPMPDGHPVLDAIQSARQSLDVQMYLITDDSLVQGLVAAAERGVKVRVLLEPRPYTGPAGSQVNPNYEAMRALKGTPVQVDWTSPQFRYTHQKSMIVDKQAVWIMTANMSKSARLSNREYIVVASNKGDVAEAQRLFDSDWSNKPYTLGAAAKHLVISPNNARPQLLGLIGAARRALDVGIEVLGDPEVHQALIARARGGVRVRVLIADPSKYPDSRTPQFAAELQGGGCEVRYLVAPAHHAKLIVADGQVAYTGSVNLSSNSLDNNRELGILIAQPDVLQGLSGTFEQDWAAGRAIGG